MANPLNTDIKSKIIEMQGDFLFSRLIEQVGGSMTKEEILSLVNQTIQRYYMNIGRPLMIKRSAEDGHLPFYEDYHEMMDEVVADTVILYGEITRIGNALAEHFNYAQSEKLRLNNRIKNTSSATNDLNLLANENTKNSIYLKDSFVDQNQIEYSMIMGSPIQISTREGIATLTRTGTTNRSNKAKIKLIQGDGEKGTDHLAKRINTTSSNNTLVSTVSYVKDQTPNDKPESILDGRPDTIFEYQVVSVDLKSVVELTKGYDINWAKDNNPNDKLRLKLVIELEEPSDINWININPYIPENSTGKLIVYSIRTSEDGFEYKSLYEDGNYVINAEINTTPQTYRQDEVFNGSNDYNASKFAGQGVWSFATRKAKYVEFVFDQPEAYKELIGHTYYERITVSDDPSTGKSKETAVRIPSSQVPEAIQKSGTGRYVISNTEYIQKNIEVFDGLRRAIGIRDINIMSYQFAEKSELVTTKFNVDKPIKEVMLYANEKIPEAFLQDLTKANDWIQYYISVDDVNWYQISPVHQAPVNGKPFPPKIYEFNTINTDLQNSFQLYKGYLKTQNAPTSIRLKAIMQRPTNILDASSYTPILEDYSLRVIFEDQNA